jgi:hypothetical protein
LPVGCLWPYNRIGLPALDLLFGSEYFVRVRTIMTEILQRKGKYTIRQAVDRKIYEKESKDTP